MIYRDSLSKFFAIALAVVCLMSCVCMTAFAAETDMPPGAQLLTNGQQISTSELVSLSTPYVISADGLEAIHITGLFGFSEIYGWDGTQWMRVSVPDPTDVTITCADYDYTYYTMLRKDTMASQTVTVTWTKVTQTGTVLSIVMSIVTAFFALGTTCVTWIVDTPLALFGVALFVLVFCVTGIMKLIK